MSMHAVLLKIDEERIVQDLQEALVNLGGAGSEVILDFSCVRRIDPGALKALGNLAGTADSRAVRIGLRGVNIDIYKVLKLMKLATRFSFLS